MSELQPKNALESTFLALILFFLKKESSITVILKDIRQNKVSDLVSEGVSE